MQKKFDNAFAALMLAAAVAVILAGAWCLSHSIARAKYESEPVITAQVHIEAPSPDPLPTPTPFPSLEPIEQLFYNPAVPLPQELQTALYDACEASDVPVVLALGVIEIESCFTIDAVSSEGCYGLMQLNPRFFPDKLSPADNIREGVGYLGRLLEQYGEADAALTAYNAGYDTGSRAYATVVLRAAEWWEEELCFAIPNTTCEGRIRPCQ